MLYRILLLMIILCCGTSYQAAAQLSGTYTIGGDSADYATISLATADIQAQGVAGPVVMNIRDGVYNEQVTLQYVFTSSPEKTITFRSESGDTSAVTIQHEPPATGFKHTFKINYTSNVILEDLTFRAINAYGIALDLSQADSCIVRNCHIYADEVYLNSCCSAPKNASVLWAQPLNRLYIEGNTIERGGNGIYIDDDYSSAEECVISNNMIIDAEVMGIRAKEVNDLQILDNTIITTEANSYATLGIYTLDCDSLLRVERNWFSMEDGSTGIYITGSDASVDHPARIANNSIFVKSGGYAILDYGIHFTDCVNIDVLHNNIHGDFSNNDSRGVFQEDAGGSSISDTEGIRILGNNVYLSDQGQVIEIEETSAVVAIDYNNFKTEDSPFGTWGGVVCNSLSAWVSNTAQDSASISVDPLFRSADNLESCNLLLMDAGLFESAVTNDFNGFSRDSIPDIGCHEYYANPCPYDYNDDHEVNSVDFLMLLAEVGCQSNCLTDTDYSCTVNTVELLAMLANYGSTCN